MLRVLELSWLTIVLLGASLGTYKLLTESLTSALWFYILAAVSTLFWLIRRKQRIRMERRAR
ncbi:MAG: hypothetical protein JNL88_04710 [Bacteroidia bacterium]|nr:hypothetical protein [Bacteroidia bacterium]